MAESDYLEDIYNNVNFIFREKVETHMTEIYN